VERALVADFEPAKAFALQDVPIGFVSLCGRHDWRRLRCCAKDFWNPRCEVRVVVTDRKVDARPIPLGLLPVVR